MAQDTEGTPRAIQPLKSVQGAAATLPPDPNQFSFGYVPRTAGVPVNESTALTFAAVFAAIRAISEDTSGLGHTTRRTLPNGRREELPNHPATRLLSYPNNETSGATLRETMQAHALSWGNGYAEIERNARRQPVALWLLTPERVTPRRIDGRIVYQVRNGGGRDDTYLEAENMLHLHGLGFDGLTGYSVIQMAARTIGMGIAGDEYGSATYNNRATPGGVLKHPKRLDDDGRKNLRDSWEYLYSGSRNAGRVAILEEGLEFEPISLPPSDVQFIENRNFQIEEIARWYRIPPHKLAHIVKATFNNIEEQNINYVQDALLPWVNRWEGEGDRKLLAPSERGTVRVKLNLNTLLRGAIEKRTESYVKGRQWGWLSANDVRSLEDMDPLDAEIGDVYLTPVNMAPTENIHDMGPGQPAASEPPPGDDDAPPAGPGAHLRPTVLDALRRCFKRELNHHHRAPKSICSREAYTDWAAPFYVKHAQYCIDALRPVCESASLQALGDVPAGLDILLMSFVEAMNTDSAAAMADAWPGAAGAQDETIAALADRLLVSVGELITIAAPSRANA